MSRPISGGDPHVAPAPLLEVIALDAEDALAARAGGADRLELAADMAADGLTPSCETFARVRAAVDLPLRVMLRGDAGFAAGGAAALDALREQARRLMAEGACEFVMGFLDEAGRPDLRAITAVHGVLGGSPWTFHRAVDHASDRESLRKALAEWADAGDPSGSGAGSGRRPDAFLTAGSPRGVDDGLEVLRAEAARTAAREGGFEPDIIAGGGLRLEHVPALAAAGVTAFHVGGAVRRGGWSGSVDVALVGQWREALDAAGEAAAREAAAGPAAGGDRRGDG